MDLMSNWIENVLIHNFLYFYDDDDVIFYLETFSFIKIVMLTSIIKRNQSKCSIDDMFVVRIVKIYMSVCKKS